MEKCAIIFITVVGIFIPRTLTETELPVPSEKPFLIARPYPALAKIGQLFIDVKQPLAEPNQYTLICKEIENKVKHKLCEAGVKVINADDEQRYTASSLFIPQFRVDIETINFDDSTQCVFRVQTSLSRAVQMGKQNDSPCLFRADVWRTKPVLQVASGQDMPAVVSSVVLKQVEDFIIAWYDANPQNRPVSDANDIVISETPSEMKSSLAAKTSVAEYKYVASKSSKVFHKPECRWAKGISSENLMNYNSREEAINDGKRPCKMCKP